MPLHIPDVIDCACGQSHDRVPTKDWHGLTVDTVCRTHRRHTPCEPCMSEWLGIDNEGLALETSTFISTAKAQLGYTALAYNDSEFGRQAGYPQAPWDGALLEYARRESGLGGPVLTNSTAALAWFVQNHRAYRKPKTGDVAFFAFSTHGHLSQPHVGIVVDTDAYRKSGFFRVLEGQIDSGERRSNTEENAVHERTRHTDDVITFGRLPILQDAPKEIIKNNKIHYRMLQGKNPGAVTTVQLALADTVGLQNAKRGVYDSVTRAAYARFQREVGVYGEHGNPEDRGLRLLGERTGRFSVEG